MQLVHGKRVALFNHFCDDTIELSQQVFGNIFKLK